MACSVDEVELAGPGVAAGVVVVVVAVVAAACLMVVVHLLPFPFASSTWSKYNPSSDGLTGVPGLVCATGKVGPWQLPWCTSRVLASSFSGPRVSFLPTVS